MLEWSNEFDYLSILMCKDQKKKIKLNQLFQSIQFHVNYFVFLKIIKLLLIYIF